MTNTPINELAARYAMHTALINAIDAAASTTANNFEYFSDDDFDYFPASTSIAATLAAYIEPIRITTPDSTECLDAIARLAADDDFTNNMLTNSMPYISLFMPNAEYDDAADILESTMLRDAYNAAFAALDIPADCHIRDIPADFAAALDAEQKSIHNAFINAHRAAYPASYTSTDDPTDHTLAINPYL